MNSENPTTEFENTLAFLKEKGAPVETQVNQPIKDTASQSAKEIIANPDSQILPSLDEILNESTSKEKQNEAGETSTEETSIVRDSKTGADTVEQSAESNQGELEVEDKKGPQESIRVFRKTLTETQKILKEKESELNNLKSELGKYQTGEALPEVVKQKEERISQLEKYERLHALRLSPEYQEKYIKPIEDLNTKALSLAAEYGVSKEVLDEAINVENRREMNSILRDHFDDVGALEMRDMLVKLRDARGAAVQAEQEPAQELTKIKEEYALHQRAQEERRIDGLINNSKRGWEEALTKLRGTEKYPELVFRDNDEEHNKLVKPIVEAAATEYGKFVKMLGAMGLKELPAEVADMLAQRFQLSQAAGVMAMSRADHFKRAEQINKVAQKHATMNRPPLGAVNPSMGRVEPKEVPSIKDEVSNLLNNVLRK